jgi:hypothetical protein
VRNVSGKVLRQNIIRFVKSTVEGGEIGEEGSAGDSRKRRQVGKIDVMVARMWGVEGREMSPA